MHLREADVPGIRIQIFTLSSQVAETALSNDGSLAIATSGRTYPESMRDRVATFYRIFFPAVVNPSVRPTPPRLFALIVPFTWMQRADNRRCVDTRARTNFKTSAQRIARTLTPVTAGDLVPQDIYLVHSAVLLEHRPQVVLVHVVRYLTHEHLYVVRIRLLHAVVVHYAAT